MPSEKVLEKNKKKVAEIAERLKGSVSGVLIDYRGLTVSEDTQLRSKFREAGVKYTVVKNTLTNFAAKEAGLEDLEPVLHGPTSLATHETDVVAPAKIIVDFAKDHKVVEIKSGFIEGKVVSVDEIKAIASLPSKEELVAKALAGFNAPIAGFVNVLNGNIRGLVIALNAIAEQKQ
ncbi:MAG: 50S ribosomal protein L10 [Eubacteriales bacterium]|jgi:large subunit ribosomal protein L10|nr:50S ribosomal protein L10 [Eubacteriales bacterium]